MPAGGGGGGFSTTTQQSQGALGYGSFYYCISIILQYFQKFKYNLC
jgi:hypothetical protein